MSIVEAYYTGTKERRQVVLKCMSVLEKEI